VDEGLVPHAEVRQRDDADLRQLLILGRPIFDPPADAFCVDGDSASVGLGQLRFSRKAAGDFISQEVAEASDAVGGTGGGP
jgi:hypothetical protein